MSTHNSSDSSSFFEWDDYLSRTGARPADPKCFKQSRIPPQNLFEVNALLEAEDQRSAAHDVQTTSPFTPDGFKTSTTGSTGVGSGVNRRPSLATNPVGTLRRFRAAAFSLAQVVEVWGPRLRIRLIGTDDRNDCWFLVDSDQIRPIRRVNPPPFGYMYNHLNWSRTLKSATEGAKFADPSWFVESPSDPTDNFFQVGDKLEAVDRHNSQLICPATIGAVNGQHIFVSFDGWSGAFDYWTRFDSRELFPVGWCKLADYPLQSPGPNALRSPTNQSTPAPARPLTSFRSGPLNTSSATETPSLPGSAKRPIGTKRLEKRNRSHAAKHGGRPNSRRRVKSSVLRRQRLSAIVHKPIGVAKPEVPASDTVWPSETVKRLTSVSSPHPELTDSANSSMRSMSSPPTIHPMNEDASESALNLSVSSSDQPPAIEVALPIQSDPPRVRRISNSSDCVVRLQAKSPPVPSDRADYTKPEHKSWQVVPISPQSQRKAPKRHRHSVDKASRLRKKFKLVGTSERPTFATLKGELDKHSTSKETISTLRQDEHSNKTKPEVSAREDATPQRPTSPSSLPLPSLQHSHATHFRSDRSGQTPLHLYCGDYNTAALASYETKPVAYLPPQSESVSSGEHLDDDVASSVTRSNGVAQSYTSGLWYPSSRMEYNSSKMLDAHAASSHATDDYSDGQSLAPHVSSSTVSPSSLDLGPGPLPNPALWTIDEVYHYLTTRDPSLLEVAQKFKHHEIDGQALLLLNMESLRNYLQVKLGPALKVDHLISRIKRGLL
ncbi:polycomb protein SCMH1 [Clonorchis sinensis]|uniref:Polycomb protein SCMH1 n=1 Tax=Clonorchis sinensis TaxID=79923 RepID=G7YH68_CLOSI|nr:polycomb protein SCMH1 [Clonorchis sinensis]